MLKGKTEPRLWTKPLRPLTPETSRGFEVIEFSERMLHVLLYPWQKWLLIHMLELNPDGTMRFRKALVIVGRQNGKTLVGAVLCAYWLWVDSVRWREQSPPDKFEIVGAAHKLDIAMKPWKQVRSWGAPDDPKIGISPDRIPDLQDATFPPHMVNGEVELRTHESAKYLPRTFEGARGRSASRLLLDELRTQSDFESWGAIEKSANSQWDSLLVAFSNAGTAKSLVLARVRETAIKLTDDPDAEWFLAEWSASPDAGLDDPDAFAQSNPSAGYRAGFTIKGLLRSAANTADEKMERTEVLGQWIISKVLPYIAPARLDKTNRTPADIAAMIPFGARTVWGVDTSQDRSMSYIAAAVELADGSPFCTLRVQRAGMLWVTKYLRDLADESKQREIALATRGCPSAEFLTEFEAADLHVHKIEGGAPGAATGRFKDHFRDLTVATVPQPAVRLALSGAVTTRYAENDAWSLTKSLPIDIAPVRAMTWALYGLEMCEPPAVVEPAPHPPAGEVITHADPALVNLASVAF